LRAGTNCGSCIPELKAILSGAYMDDAAEPEAATARAG
jgi:NAD(P)H-nitrite reductase large subunit